MTLPGDLPFQIPRLFLGAQLQQGPQSELDRFSLGLGSRGPQRLLHELVIDLDIRAHDVYPLLREYTS